MPIEYESACNIMNGTDISLRIAFFDATDGEVSGTLTIFKTENGLRIAVAQFNANNTSGTTGSLEFDCGDPSGLGTGTLDFEVTLSNNGETCEGQGPFPGGPCLAGPM